MRRNRISLLAIVVAALLGIAGISCQSSSPPPAPTPSSQKVEVNVDHFQSVAQPSLPNAYIVTQKVIAGAQPEGDEGFKALRDLGVKTIVSVDGAAPDVE